jgi:hypothetical protein
MGGRGFCLCGGCRLARSEGAILANKDDQIFQMLTVLRAELSSVDARLQKMEDDVKWLRSDLGTVGNWVKEIRDRR